MTPAGAQRRLQAAVAGLSTALFLLTAPGRIPFPDDEIVFQTTQSLYERGSLAIPGIARRSGEMAGQAKGTFGWSEGADGQRYGFFGHGLSLVALPAYALAKLTFPLAPPTWRYAVRSDHLAFHDRDPFADWARLVVSLTNAAITGVTAGVLVAWLVTLGFGLRAATLTALGYALGTAAWPYTRTFLSEPLSALCLLLCALGIARYHRGRRRADGRGVGWLWAAGAIAGFAAHVHVLNLSAIPCLLVYALWPLWREGGGAALRRERRAWGGAALLGLVGVAALGLSHYLRFGSAFETGRFGIYSWLVPPWTGLAALAVAPGRSLFLYAPAVTLGLAGIPALRRRLPVVAAFAAAMILVRAATISLRSDWFGGWALGPRHLVPVLPFAIVPLAALWERALRAGRGARLALGGLELAAVGLCLYLSLYSILEFMILLSRDPAVRAFGSVSDASHWWPSASPIVGYRAMKVDVLSVGAWRLAERGHWGLAVIFACVAAVAIAAAVILVRTLRRAPGVR
ncbi:MAG: hypothetical protein R3A79_00470 [Nannocystaceae bacterium]